MKKQYRKGCNFQLSKNFNSDEFDCKCNYSDCQWTIVDTDHIEKLQKMRTKWKKSIRITSGYRCSKHNKDEGGSTNSRHVRGDATDIEVKNKSISVVQKDCDKASFDGLGRYDTFTHVDSRGHTARWDFRKKNAKR